MIIIGIVSRAAVCRRAALPDAVPLAVETQAVVIRRDDSICAVLVHDVRQPVERIVSVARRAEDDPDGVGAGDRLPVVRVSIWLRLCRLTKGGSALSCQGASLHKRGGRADAKKSLLMSFRFHALDKSQ